MIYKLKSVNRKSIGNYIFHLCHTILLAKFNRNKIIIPINNSLSALYPFELILDFRMNKDEEPYIDILDEFNIHPNKIVKDNNTFFDRYSCIKKYLIPNQLNIEFKKTNKDCLVIHCRSGDIFNRNGVNEKYSQPPLSYYIDIIENNKYNEIIILTNNNSNVSKKDNSYNSELLINPIIKPLIELYPYIQLQNNKTVEYDFLTLCNCYNLVLSRGSFSVAASILNNNLINLYIPIFDCKNDDNFGNNIYLDNKKYSFKIHRNSKSIKYGNKMFKWKNTDSQRLLMLN